MASGLKSLAGVRCPRCRDQLVVASGADEDVLVGECCGCGASFDPQELILLALLEISDCVGQLACAVEWVDDRAQIRFSRPLPSGR